MFKLDKTFIRKIFENFKNRDVFDHLINVTKRFHVISIGLDEIVNGVINQTENRNKIKHSIFNLKYSIFILIFMLVSTLVLFAFLISDQLFSLYKFPTPISNFRIIVLVVVISSILIFVIKIDFILGQINYELSSLKMFYFLKMNLKLKHKLNAKNYKKLVILSQIIVLSLLDYGVSTAVICAAAFNTTMSLWTKKFIWIIEAIKLTPFYLIQVVTLSTWMCIVYILICYYKFRFDQVNHQIKSFISKQTSNIVNRKFENRLTQLINEHNSISIEVNRFNLLMRRSTATMFLITSLLKITIIYLVMNAKHILMKLIFLNCLLFTFLFGLGISYLFSLEIKSAHRSRSLIYSMLCNYKMRPSFRLKVSKIIDQIKKIKNKK